MMDNYLIPLERLEKELRAEMSKIFFEDAIDEFVLAYMSDDLERLRARKKAGSEIQQKRTFEKRPFVKYPAKTDL